MLNIISDLSKVCLDCLSLNSQGYSLFYGIIVLYAGLARSNQLSHIENSHAPGISDLSQFTIPPPTLQAMILQFLSSFMTPNTYVSILNSFALKIDRITGVSRRSFAHNVAVFFLFYYLIVSAPAAVMMPVNYDAKYNFDSIAALFLMMLTNAAGDVVSFKITMNNVRKITRFQEKLTNDIKEPDFRDSIKTEITLYVITISDMILASAVCFLVLLLTSVYFGISIGEYKLEASYEALSGSYKRILCFWSTAWEPYWISKNWGEVSGGGLPMLLFYSVSSFIPTLIFVLFSVLWTILMPMRIIFFSKMKTLTKIIASEVVVFVLCTLAMSFWAAL